MAYQTGVYTTEANARDILAAFAVSSGGFTINKQDSNHLALQKGSLYFNFNSGLKVSGSTGYNGSLAWNRQPGSDYDINPSNENIYGATFCTTNTASSGAVYHLFYNDTSITMFVQGTTQFGFLSFGSTTIGVPYWNCSHGGGGAAHSGASTITTEQNTFKFMTGLGYTSVGTSSETYSSAGFYLNGSWTNTVSSNPIRWIGGYNYATDTTPVDPSLFAHVLLSFSTSEFKGNTLLVPTYLNKSRTSQPLTAADRLYDYVGEVPGLFLIDGQFYLDGDTLTIGSDQYIVGKIDKASNNTSAFWFNRLAVACKK